MIRFSLLALLSLAAALPLATACATEAPGERSRINGSISIGPGERAGDVATVNGSIKLGAKAQVMDAEAVNGSIDAADGASARSLEVVNGSIQIGVSTRISGNVKTVNGAIEIGARSEVGGDVENVNGRLTLRGARVAGSLRTVRGDIELAAGARIDGDLLVEKPSLGMNWGSRPPPRIVIGPGCVVAGRLRFEYPVELYVSDRATIGPIDGATPTRYSGEAPPTR